MSELQSRSTDKRRQLKSEITGPHPGNTGATTRQETTGGVDFLELSFYGCWRRESWDTNTALWSKLQAEPVPEGAPADWLNAFETAEGDLVAVKPYGTGRKIRCRWGLLWRGVQIGIVDMGAQGSESTPCVRVGITSDYLMAHGHEAALEHVRGILVSLGFLEFRCGVSRLDVCVDLPGQSVEEFVDAWNAGRVVKRARQYTVHGDGLKRTGITLGKGFHCRIYDKLAEAAGKSEKVAILVERRWNGAIPDDATRVEFQMRREELADQFGTVEVEQVFAKLPLICEWLTGHWLRFTAAEVDRDNRHQDRVEVSLLWERVAERFQAWAGACDEPWLKPIKRVTIDATQLHAQALGCLAKAAALMGQVVTNEVEFVRFVQQSFSDYAAGVGKCQAKARQLEFSSALGPPIPAGEIPF